MLHLVLCVYRSEIHDKMNCIRCRKKYSTKSDRCESTVELNRVESVGETCQTSQDADIGGFAEISGCLHKLKGSERQVCFLAFIWMWDDWDHIFIWTLISIIPGTCFKVGTPLEEDLLNWAHHSSHTSVPDVVFQASAGNEVNSILEMLPCPWSFFLLQYRSLNGKCTMHNGFNRLCLSNCVLCVTSIKHLLNSVSQLRLFSLYTPDLTLDSWMIAFEQCCYIFQVFSY